MAFAMEGFPWAAFQFLTQPWTNMFCLSLDNPEENSRGCELQWRANVSTI